jgi:hypothetical protein
VRRKVILFRLWVYINLISGIYILLSSLLASWAGGSFASSWYLFFFDTSSCVSMPDPWCFWSLSFPYVDPLTLVTITVHNTKFRGARQCESRGGKDISRGSWGFGLGVVCLSCWLLTSFSQIFPVQLQPKPAYPRVVLLQQKQQRYQIYRRCMGPADMSRIV